MVKMNHMLKQKKQQLIWFILIIFHYSSNVKVTVQIFWKEFGGVSIPTREEDLVGKWIAAIYETKTKSILCVGKMMKRFLKEKDGQTESMELDCLVPAYRKDTKVLSEEIWQRRKYLSSRKHYSRSTSRRVSWHGKLVICWLSSH